MISGASAAPYYLHTPQIFHTLEGLESNNFMQADGGSGGETAMTTSTSVSVDTNYHVLLYNLSVLKDKVHQLQPLVAAAVSHDGTSRVTLSGAGAVIQEIIAAASSMMHAFQQLSLGPAVTAPAIATNASMEHEDIAGAAHRQHDHNTKNSSQGTSGEIIEHVLHNYTVDGGGKPPRLVSSALPVQTSPGSDEIIELDAAELLAKYTHYCQVCGKGFKRDANLRMHMRAHGDEYKTSAALANPTKENGATAGDDQIDTSVTSAASRKYSCPHEGCRWNRKHAKFQPLKSVICVKNHYKRSHCPKMYICNRCNRKQFSVLSDLRTHEKHCGHQRWLCSCGTTFSRKDKLLGHVALFIGHAPAFDCLVKQQQGKRVHGNRME